MLRSRNNRSFRRAIWLSIISLSLAGFDQLVAANRPPAIVEDHTTITGTGAVTISVLTNDSDPDGNPFTLVSVTTPGKGTASVSGANVIYTPGGGYSGFDYFYYTVRDSLNATSSGLISTHPPYTPSNASDKYYLWATAKFGSDMTSNPARKDTFWGENADADGDGDSNLLEYATGSEPLDWSQRANVFHDNVIAPGYLALRVQQRTDDTDLVFIPQMSLGLSSWLLSLPSTAKLWTGDSTYIATETRQTGSQSKASALRKQRDASFDGVVCLRRETQFAADTAWPWHNDLNLGRRREFLLPAGRAFVG